MWIYICGYSLKIIFWNDYCIRLIFPSMHKGSVLVFDFWFKIEIVQQRKKKSNIEFNSKVISNKANALRRSEDILYVCSDAQYDNNNKNFYYLLYKRNKQKMFHINEKITQAIDFFFHFWFYLSSHCPFHLRFIVHFKNYCL